MPVTYTLESGLLHLIATGEYEPRDIPAAFLAGLADENCPNPAGARAVR